LDPESVPVGSGTVSSILIRKKHSGSEQLWIRNEFVVKLLWKTDKIRQVLKKNAQLKKIYSFLSKILT
jgi:hypothetical protein